MRFTRERRTGDMAIRYRPQTMNMAGIERQAVAERNTGSASVEKAVIGGGVGVMAREGE